MGEHAVILDVGGVGFRVHVPSSALAQMPAIGQTVELQTYLCVRENELSLFGFATQEEHDLFVSLLGVPGIGPRTALSILSTFSPETLRQAVTQGDAQALTRIPGIGRKTAQRLVLDLKDRIGPPEEPWQGSGIQAGDADAISALTALGYSIAEAQSALSAVPDDVRELDERILAALRHLGSH